MYLLPITCQKFTLDRSDQTSMSSPINKQPLYSRMSGFGKDMMMAGVGASVAKTITSPIERVKLLLQLQATSTQIAKDKQYKGAINFN